jgi:hypothetical protein
VDPCYRCTFHICILIFHRAQLIPDSGELLPQMHTHIVICDCRVNHFFRCKLSPKWGTQTELQNCRDQSRNCKRTNRNIHTGAATNFAVCFSGVEHIFFRFAQSPLCAIFNVRIEINRFFMTGNCRFRCSYFFIVAVGCVGLRKLCPF